jgi:hypothetical protein
MFIPIISVLIKNLENHGMIILWYLDERIKNKNQNYCLSLLRQWMSQIMITLIIFINLKVLCNYWLII